MFRTLSGPVSYRAGGATLRRHHRVTRLALLLIGVGLVIASGSAAAASDAVDFGRDVLPILSDRCLFCHGPDAQANDSGLRLDLPEEALGELPSGEGAAVVPGDPEKSELLTRILSTDPSLQMPPPESKLEVTEAEAALLRQWIAEGGDFEGHWAFEPLPASVPLPPAEPGSWVRQPLDAFVLAKLNTAGLAPSPEADRARWLRRVSFDLTGLPPTPEQLTAFEADRSDTAYETVVDRLLSSEHFGEHMAVAWLDAARYADSYGYQSDQLNTQWPYRDWVVDAFNQNLPYDQFLTWQLAGDLVEEPTPQQRLATAFNRLHRLTNEGGSVFEEWRVENVADRVHTFGTVMLGLTMECCRCHDHKYDPISMRDYYSLFAFFNSIDENGLYDQAEKIPSPTMLLPTAEQAAALDVATTAVRDAEQHFLQMKQAAMDGFEPAIPASDDAQAQIPDLQLALDFDQPYHESMKDVYRFTRENLGSALPLDSVPVTDSNVARMPADSTTAAGEASAGELERRAIEFDGERGVTAPGVEAFDRWTPFTVVITLRHSHSGPERAVIAHHSRGTDAGYNGWDLTIEDGFLESRLYRVWPGNALGVRSVDRIPTDRWVQLAATYDGSSRGAGLKLFLDGKPLPTTVLRDEVLKSANVAVAHGGAFVLGQRFRSRGFMGGLADDLRIFSRDLTHDELRHLATGEPLTATAEIHALAFDEPTRAAAAGLKQARQALVMAEESMHEVPVMKELPEPLPAHILARGEYNAPRSEQTLVSRDTFESLPPAFPHDAPRDRLGLAEWLTLPDHPLTARVAVNRLWANFFGTGLVATAENFGRQGERPSHPELLDWLARDFVTSGWDVKRACKQLALSATYRQESRLTPETLTTDPENRLLARGPAYRLSGEQIRDGALAASGLLDRRRGGPPVSPYQPGGDLWRESNGMSPPYRQAVGRDLYRRSLYSVWKRTAPLPNMMAFDASTREVCTVRRARTNTPLQALVLLNDVQFVEAARKLAELAMSQHSEDAARIEGAFVALTGRSADGFEEKALMSLLQRERAHYQQHADEAAQLLRHGESPAGEFEPAELAALTVVCQAIMNLDASVWKR